MGYKEKVEEEIKKDKLKNLWREIFEAYERGGVEEIKLKLNSITGELIENYKQLLERLVKML